MTDAQQLDLFIYDREMDWNHGNNDHIPPQDQGGECLLHGFRKCSLPAERDSIHYSTSHPYPHMMLTFLRSYPTMVLPPKQKFQNLSQLLCLPTLASLLRKLVPQKRSHVRKQVQCHLLEKIRHSEVSLHLWASFLTVTASPSCPHVEYTTCCGQECSAYSEGQGITSMLYSLQLLVLYSL